MLCSWIQVIINLTLGDELFPKLNPKRITSKNH